MYTYAESMIGIQIRHTKNPLMEKFKNISEKLDLPEIEDWYNMSEADFIELLEDIEDEITFNSDEEEKFCINMLQMLKDNEELSYFSGYNGSGDAPLTLHHDVYTEEYNKHSNESDVLDYHVNSTRLEKQLKVVKKMEKFINDLPYDDDFKNTLLQCSGIVYNQMSS